MKYSLIIPCYNESKSIPALLEKCGLLISKVKCLEVILVDNGSTDSTAEVLSIYLPKFKGCRSVRVPSNRGYGYGIKFGLKHARGEILGWAHADLQFDPSDAIMAIQKFEEKGNDCFVKGLRRKRSFGDVFFTIGMSIFESIVLRCGLWDINAQPTFFPKTFFLQWTNPPDDFSLDLYAYYMAKRHKLSIFRFPVIFSPRAHGVSHWNINYRAKWKFILRLIQFSFAIKKEKQPQ